LTVDAELSLIVEGRGGHDHTRREHDQRLKTPAIERKILDERAVYHRADRRRLGIHQRHATFDGYRLGDGTNRHLNVDLQRILDVKDYIRLDDLL
jgi:hypothetical protein